MPLARPSKPRFTPVPALDSVDPGERRLAVADSMEADCLFARLGTEEDAGVRHAIFTRLGALGEAAVAVRLVAILASDDAALRNDAILALRRCGEAALPALGAALESVNPDVRIFAANALEGIATPAARGLLIALLDQEGDANVCLAAVEAMAHIGAPNDVAALAALRGRFADEPGLGFAVALAIDAIGEEV